MTADMTHGTHRAPLQEIGVTQFAVHDFRRRGERMFFDLVVIEDVQHFIAARF